MDALKAIHSRRSIRKYTDQAISEAELTELIKAAMDAPSALDEQPWQFVVITEPSLLKEIPQYHNHSDLVAGAPAAILVCGDRDKEKLPGFWVQDCAACAQNILLAAHAKDLGAVWIGVYPTEANVIGLQKMFSLPETIVPFALIALGHPDEPYPEKKNFDPKNIYWNQFKE